MGFGNYSHAAHEALLRDRADLPEQEVFKQSRCHDLMNPKGVKARESRDSDEHPNTVPIAFALDVTGSMGAIPRQLAREELPKFMKVLMASGIADPQILFMAVGDATSDRAPLQVGQFESTEKLMDQWLTWSFLEGGGGAFGTESYELAFYFLAEHTDTDAWVKRKKKGYAFVTGDEHPYPHVSKAQVDTLIGDHLDEDIPVGDVIAAAGETFHTFFLIPDQARRARAEPAWRDLLGDYVIAMEDPRDTCFVAAALVALTEGAKRDVDQVAAALAETGASKDQVGSVVRAITPYATLLAGDGPKTTVRSRDGFWKRLLK